MKVKFNIFSFSIFLLLLIRNRSVICGDYEDGADEDVMKRDRIDHTVEIIVETNTSKTGLTENATDSKIEIKSMEENGYANEDGDRVENDNDDATENISEESYSKIDSENNESSTETEDESKGETQDEEVEGEDEDYYSEEEDNNSEGGGCSLDYFYDRLMPDDYNDGKDVNISRNVKHINETILRLNRISEYAELSFNRMTPFIRQLGSRLSDLLFNIDLEPQCLKSIFKIMNDLRSGKSWAMRFIDSAGNPLPKGILDGTFSDFGEFDECLNIEEPETSDDPITRGKYCLLKPILPLPEVGSFKVGEKIPNLTINIASQFGLDSYIPQDILNQQDKYINTMIEAFEYFNRTIFRFGICIPSTCSHIEIENAINKVFFPKFRIPFEVGPDCVTKYERIPLDKHQKISLSVMAILSSIAIISTLFELYFKKSKTNYFSFKDQNQVSCWKEFFTSFSIIKNTQSLFSKSNERFTSIETMRLLMMVWIFIMNSYLWTLIYGNMGLKRFYFDGPYKLMIESKYFYVRLPQLIDTLFLISGLLSVFSFGSYKNFSYFLFVGKRWLRFTPVLIGSILFIYLCPLFGDGPLWGLSAQLLVNPCKYNIMPTLFYYNNYNGSIEHTCNMMSVYLSASFQLHLIAPIILIPLMKLKPAKAILFNILCILIGCGICTVPKLVFGIRTPYEILYANSFQEIKNSIMQYYMGAHQHISTYSIGILVGYLIKYKPNLNLGGKLGELFIWILAPTCTVLAILWNEKFSFIEIRTTHLENMIWIAFGKVLWCSGFSWILYSCCTGRGGYVNRILSLKVFRPFARLSMCFYLLSSMVVAYRLLSVRQTWIMKDELVYRAALTDFALINAFAYIFYLLVERPVINLMKIFFKKEVSKNATGFDDNLKHKAFINSDCDGNFDHLEKVSTVNKTVIVIK